MKLITPISQIRLNTYGNVTEVPTGWEETNATVTQLKKLKIPTVKYCSGFRSYRGYYSPILNNLIPKNQSKIVKNYFQNKIETKIKKSKETKKKRLEFFRRKYVSKMNALPDACEGMKNLNRYAKYVGTPENEEIYFLKEKFLQFLIDYGKLKTVKTHIVEREGKECWSCDRSGINEEGEDCEKCDGTGWYITAHTKTFFLYIFKIGDKTYNWHSPYKMRLPKSMKIIDEPYSGWEEGKLRELELPKNQFNKYTQLITWVMT